MDEPAETAKKVANKHEHDGDLTSSLCRGDDGGDEMAGQRQETQNHRIL